jgi:hypothetical protein
MDLRAGQTEGRLMTEDGLFYEKPRRTAPHIIFGVGATLWILLGSHPLWAHSGEAITQEIFGFDDETSWLIRTNFGVITSDNPREFVCEEAFLGGDFFLVAPLSTTHWATFGETSVHLTTDGCSFERVMELDEAPTDAEAHLASGRIAFATNSERDSGVWWSQGGNSFERIPTDPSLFVVTGMTFINSETILATSYRNDPSRAAGLHLIDLESETVEQVDLTNLDGLSFPYLMTGHDGEFVWLVRRQIPMSTPPEYERVVYWGSLVNPARFFYLTDSWPTGASLAEDHQSITISGVSAGFGIAEGKRREETVSWTTRAEQTTANCVGRIGSGIHLCTRRLIDGADALEVLETSFQPLLDFRELEGPRSGCESGSQTDLVCPLVWPEVAKSLQLEEDTDAGMPDAGPNADAGFPTDTGHQDTSEGCGLCAAGAPASPQGFLITLWCALVAGMRSQRRDETSQVLQKNGP